MRPYPFVIAFFLLLAAPLAVHWAHREPLIADSGSREAPRLVVITPAPQDIRDEFRWAFAEWHRRHFGYPVQLDYLVPGGTNDIERQLSTIYQAIRAHNHGALPPADRLNPDIQIVWGGGDFFIDHELKPLGILQPLPLSMQEIKAAFPDPTLAGVKLLDWNVNAQGQVMPPKWMGVCLSSFGIVYNPDLYRSLNLPAPRTWSDLENPRLAGSISLADPTHSASSAIAYEMILQRAMANAEAGYFAERDNAGKNPSALKKRPEYQLALDRGWTRGMRELVLLAANARYFTDDASLVPTDVANGNAAAGLAIDFYGRVTEETVGPQRERFVTPPAATAITPDPVAVLYGVHGQKLEWARHFLEFLISPEGQRLYIVRAGKPGGPRQRSLRRMPIRRDVYSNRINWTDDFDYFRNAGNFNERVEWMDDYADLRMIWAAAWIDDRQALRDAYDWILRVADAHRREALLAELSDIPVTRGDVRALMNRRKAIAADPSEDPDLWRARTRIAWAERFREHYRRVAAEAENSSS